MDAALIDTDTLNEVLKQKNVNVVGKGAEYLSQHGQFSMSSITRYEAYRGLKQKNAAAQLARFYSFCANTLILPVTNDILDAAAEH